MVKLKGFVGALAVLVAMLIFGIVAGTAGATVAGQTDNGSPGHQPVGICHATGSQSNPFVYITPDASGVYDGHLDHQYANDIIPAFHYTNAHGDTISFGGQNLSTLYGGVTGSVLLANECKAPSPHHTGSITLIKHLSPSSDTGVFTLKVGDHAVATNIGDGGTGTASGLTAGSYTVSEVAGTGTSLDNYTSTVWCTNEASGTVSATVHLGDGQNVTCTFTNTRKSTPPPPPGQCPEGTTPIGTNPLVCLKTVTTTVTVYGTPSCPSGTTQTSSGPGYVVCNTSTTTTVPGPTQTVTVYGNPQCPSGTTEESRGQGTVTCIKTVTNTVTNTVTKIVIKKVPGKTKIVIKKVKVKVPSKPVKHHAKPPKHTHFTP